MAIDFCLAFECDIKRHFGHGDCLKGADSILERLKAGNRAQMVRQIAQREGRDPYSIPFDLITSGSDGNQIQKTVTLAELEEHAKSLLDHSAACAACPAKCLDDIYGCIGCINYPISAKAEDWLLSRMQPANTFGAHMCFDFLAEHGITGEQAAAMRHRGLFEMQQPKNVVLKKALFKSQSVSADQLFESMFMVGNPIDPFHCFGLLIWFGALRLDGRVLTDPDDHEGLAKLLSLNSPEAKAECTQQVLGPSSDSEEILDFESYFRAMFLSWHYDVPLLVSA